MLCCVLIIRTCVNVYMLVHVHVEMLHVNSMPFMSVYFTVTHAFERVLLYIHNTRGFCTLEFTGVMQDLVCDFILSTIHAFISSIVIP